MYMTQALHRAVQQHPDRVAVRCAGRQRSFRELADRVARLAGALQTLGMRDGDRVAMLSLNSDRYLEYQMAVPWGGGVLNPCNTRWSAAEILYSLDDSGSTGAGDASAEAAGPPPIVSTPADGVSAAAAAPAAGASAGLFGAALAAAALAAWRSGVKTLLPRFPSQRKWPSNTKSTKTSSSWRR